MGFCPQSGINEIALNHSRNSGNDVQMDLSHAPAQAERLHGHRRRSIDLFWSEAGNSQLMCQAHGKTARMGSGHQFRWTRHSSFSITPEAIWNFVENGTRRRDGAFPMLMGAQPMDGCIPSVGSHFSCSILALPHRSQYLEKLLVIPFAHGPVRCLVIILRRRLRNASIAMLLGYYCQIYCCPPSRTVHSEGGLWNFVI